MVDLAIRLRGLPLRGLLPPNREPLRPRGRSRARRRREHGGQGGSGSAGRLAKLTQWRSAGNVLRNPREPAELVTHDNFGGGAASQWRASSGRDASGRTSPSSPVEAARRSSGEVIERNSARLDAATCSYSTVSTRTRNVSVSAAI